MAHRCTFEWDVEVGKDDRGDPVLKRHLCMRKMGHRSGHIAEDGTRKPRLPMEAKHTKQEEK